MSKELDLDGIKAKYERAALGIETWLPVSIVRTIEEIPALLDEVERLRTLKSEMVRQLMETSVFTAKQIGWSLECVAESLANAGIQGVFAENSKLRTKVEQILKVLEDHPGCDKYADDDVISCGWKRSIRDIEKILEAEK